MPKKSKPAKRRAFYKSPPPQGWSSGFSLPKSGKQKSDKLKFELQPSAHFTLREDGSIGAPASGTARSKQIPNAVLEAGAPPSTLVSRPSTLTGTHHVIFSIGYALQQLGFKILNDIAWEKPNPPPNLSCRYFTHSTETVLWAAKNDKSKHVFNYQEMRKVTGKQMKTVWRKNEFEPQRAQRAQSENKISALSAFSAVEELDPVWTMTAPGSDEKTHGKHPTQKPVALVERCLLASTREDDLVLDPLLLCLVPLRFASARPGSGVWCPCVKSASPKQADATSARLLTAAVKLRQERNLCSQTIPINIPAPSGRHIPFVLPDDAAPDGALILYS